MGVAICMGDRNNALNTAEEIMSSYNMTMQNNISTILGEKWRLSDDGKTAFVNGDGVFEEDMLGSGVNPPQQDRPPFGQTPPCPDPYKQWHLQVLRKEMLRLPVACKPWQNVARVRRYFEGTWRRTLKLAGCTIPSPALEGFISCIKAKANDSEIIARNLDIQVGAEIPFSNIAEAKATVKALIPDNINFPKGLSLKVFSRGSTVAIELTGKNVPA